jgi:nitrogen fixation protein FixH
MTSAEKNTDAARAWPIGVAAFLVLFALTVVGVTVWSTFQPVDLVAPDYYSRELRYTEQMNRQVRGEERREDVTFVHQSDNLAIRFDRAKSGGVPPQGRVRLYRPSDAALDLELPLAPDATGTQMIDTRRLKAGLWRVKLTWREGGAELYREESFMVAHTGAAE